MACRQLWLAGAIAVPAAAAPVTELAAGDGEAGLDVKALCR